MSGNRKARDPLRQQAEAQLGHAPPAKAPAGSAAEQLLHELQVHQIELEMQNEALRQAQLVLEESRDRYVDLYDFSPVAYLTLTGEGLIGEINLTGAALLGEDRVKLLRRRFAPFVAAADRDAWHRLFIGAMRRDDRQHGELSLERRDGSIVLVHLDSLRISARDGPPVLRLALTDITATRKAATDAAVALRALADSLEAQVVARTAQLRALSADLAMTEERERRALAQDLHDNLSQVLAAVKIKLAALDPGSLETARGGIEVLIDQASRSVRTITQQLSPPILQTLGLAPALEWLADELERQYGLAVRVHDESEPKLLDEAARTMVFRAVRELLINVAKHAMTTRADVTCLVQDDRLMVAVSDEGCGFDAAGTLGALPGASGFGLLSMRERFDSIGGGMDIDSQPGEGTTVTLTVPLSAAARKERRRS